MFLCHIYSHSIQSVLPTAWEYGKAGPVLKSLKLLQMQQAEEGEEKWAWYQTLTETKGSSDKELQDCNLNATKFQIFKMYLEGFWTTSFTRSAECLRWGKLNFLNVRSHECRIGRIQNHWFLS